MEKLVGRVKEPRYSDGAPGRQASVFRDSRQAGRQAREGLKSLGTPVSNHLSASLALILISGDRAMRGEAQRALVSKLFPDSKLSAFLFTF